MRECRQVLRTKIGEIDGMHEKQVVVKGSGYGAYALLLALTHPETEVIAYEADEDKFLTASRCVGVPSNLHHVNGEAPAEAEGKVIEL
jgi:tRNA A58 N-methylase Trm61